MTTTLLGKVVITPRGAYDPSTAYVGLDLVTYNGSSYLAMQPVTGVTPSDDGINYQLSAAGGALTPEAAAASQAAIDAASAAGTSAGTATAKASAASDSADTSAAAANTSSTKAAEALASANSAASDAASAAAQAQIATDKAASVYGDLASTAPGKGAAQVGFLQSGVGASPRTAQDKLREVLSSADTGSTGKALIKFKETVNGDNLVMHPTINLMADDISGSTISGGGNSANPNLIGYNEFLDSISGDGATNNWTTSYDVASLPSVKVQLIRSDGVRVTVTTSCDIVASGSKAAVTYPKAGHFVNDGTGGSEGANPYVLTSQSLLISVNGVVVNVGSGCDYSGILYGYDNIISQGIMNQASGAHHRVVGGSHNSCFGGSYNRISAGDYGGIFAGTGTWLTASGSGNLALGSSNSRGFGSGPVVLIGGSGHRVSGVNAGAMGTGHTVSANGALALNRNNTVSASDSLAFGTLNTVSAVYSWSGGYGCSVSGAGYAAAWGRANSVTAQYATAKGYQAVGRCIGGDYLAGGQIAAAGDAQGFVVQVKAQTTNATATTLTVGTGATFITGPDNGAVAFTALVVAFEPATGDSKAIELKGLVKRSGSSTSIVGSLTSTVIGAAAGASAWTATATISAGTAGFRIVGTGEASKTINWSARVQVGEVSG